MGSIDTILSSMRGHNVNQTLPAPVKTVPLWLSAVRWYCRWVEFHRSREQLRCMTDHELADIGISREDALCEANRWPRLRV
jgi:uncharacterized protein YjiS (DUF1127 family)